MTAPIYTTDQFSYDKQSNTMSQEASTLGDPPQVFMVRSTHTGRAFWFELNKVIWDASHEDIIGWEYKACIKPRMHVKPHCQTIKIWND